MGADGSLFEELLSQLQKEHNRVLAELADLRTQVAAGRTGEKTSGQVKACGQNEVSPSPYVEMKDSLGPDGDPGELVVPEVSGNVQELMEGASKTVSPKQSGDVGRKPRIVFAAPESSSEEEDAEKEKSLRMRGSLASLASTQSFAQLQDMVEVNHATNVMAKAMFSLQDVFNDPVRIMKLVLGAWLEFARLQRSIVPFELHPRWKFTGDILSSSLPSAAGPQKNSLDFKQIAQERSGIAAIRRNEPGMNRFIVLPTSHKRAFWEIFGMVLLVYDLVVLPLSSFGLPELNALKVMEWVTLLFWTFDMPASCLTGYAAAGEIVVDPRLILRRYLTTWFIIDVIIVFPDWLFVLLELSGGGDSGFDGGRLLRGLRIFRSARLLRLMKAARFWERMKDAINSEAWLAALNITKLLVSLLCFSHLLASLWWIIGDFSMKEGWPNWLESSNILSRTLAYKYTTSMHWSLTQFTPASMDIQPNNALERFFALCLLLLGLVIFSSFISAITQNSMALASLQDAKAKQMWLLRKYLRQHSVSRELSFRIMKYVDYHLRLSSRHVPEAKVNLLNMLSTPLRSELQFIVSFSCLQAHPLFDRMSVMTDIMHRLVCYALGETHLAAGDVDMTVGELASEVHCLESGLLSYHRPVSDDEIEHVNPGNWLAEACMWTHWCHLGNAYALQESKTVIITAHKFSELVSKNEVAMKLASIYSTKFLQTLSRSMRRDLTDLLSSNQSYRTHSGFIEALKVEHAGDLPAAVSSSRHSTSWTVGNFLSALRGRSRAKKKTSLVKVVPDLARNQQTSGDDDSDGSEDGA